MSDIVIGAVIREHRSDEGPLDLGRIIHISEDGQTVYWIPYPGDRPGEGRGKAFHICAPRHVAKGQLEEAGSKFSYIPFVSPPSWRLTDSELLGKEVASELGDKQRKQLRKWYETREAMKVWIQPILKRFSHQQLLEHGRLDTAVRKRAKELGHAGPKKVARAMRLYFLGCGDPNALLPAWANCGGAGKPRRHGAKPGRRRRHVERGRSDDNGFTMTAEDTLKLKWGWRKYKKRGVTVRDAWLLTCHEYWPGNQLVDCRGEKLRLAPATLRPSFGQFKWAAKVAGFSARRNNMRE